MTRKNLTRSVLFLTILLSASWCFAQEDVDTGKQPVRSTFTTGMLIENPTVMAPFANSLELNIQHRFGPMENGISDIFGIYGSANTRMALTYGVTDRISVGFGTTMYNKLQDVNWKVALLKQNKSGSVPVSISYYGNMVLDARSKDFFPPAETYRFIHRFSYLTEFIFARKFNDVFSLQATPKFVYYNAVDATRKNINYGIAFGGRAKIWDSKSIMFEYDQPLTIGVDQQPNLALGLEIGTATHAFQVFVTNYRGIIGQQNMVYSTNDFTKGEYMFGFNINVKF